MVVLVVMVREKPANLAKVRSKRQAPNLAYCNNVNLALRQILYCSSNINGTFVSVSKVQDST